MKLIRCLDCGDVVALSRRWRDCDCGMAGGAYKQDGHAAFVAGPASVIGVDNRVLRGVRAEAFPYDESSGRVSRIVVNTGAFPERNVTPA